MSEKATIFKLEFQKLCNNPQLNEYPSNKILNSIVYRYSQDYLNETILELLQPKFQPKTEFEDNLQPSTDLSTTSKSTTPLVLLNTTFIKKLSRQQREWVCSICMEGCSVGEIWYTLCNCGHKFHLQCLGKWIYRETDNINCPLCRAEVC